ncbi:MAG: glycosyltransferase family 9 protein [Planctomycetes bacterium]|nr:glycosyltransferase family 9 protein [Planctomycetota bacterium]
MSFAIEVKKLADRAAGVPLVLGLRSLDRLLSRRPRDAGPLRRVLCVKLWGIGNLTMILPLVKAVHQRHPGARIEFLTLPANRAFLAACPWIDEVLLFSPAGAVRPLLALAALALRLRRRRYDLILDFEQFLRSTALLARLARPRLSVGFRTAGQLRHGLYDLEVPHDCGRHMALVFGDIVRAAGVPCGDAPALFVPRSAAAGARVARLVEDWGLGRRPLVVLHAGSGDNFPGRRWPAESFARLADLLAEARGAFVAFTGTAAERRLVARCRALSSAPSADLAGRLDLLELIELLARADLVVSNDTAPVHLGSALAAPLIAIYGPNTPRLYGPLSAAARVFYSALACSPCITNSNAKTSFCRAPLCLRSIRPAHVAAAALAMLPGPPHAAPVLRAAVLEEP